MSNKSPHLIASFGFALEGIAHAFRTQRNFKVHAGITLAVIVAGVALRISLEQWAILVVTIALVLQAELVNTALEAVVDHVAPEFHALAKIAKDCAAGAVFVSAVAAVVIGLLILGPKLLAFF
jgi:undecaprenol kinase/diacylglycerol kinase (ATP)